MSEREEGKTIKNIDFLGRTYDVTTMDPLNLGGTSTGHNVIDIDVDEGHTVHTRDGYYIVPAGVRHSAPFSMSWETASTVISSSYEFQEEFKVAVSADAGVEGGFEFSASASSREMEREAGSRKRTFVYSRAYQEDHIVDLAFDDPKAPLAVTSQFHDAVLALPYPDEMPDWVKKYEGFLKDWGTHFTTGIMLGGLAYQRTSGLATTYLRSTESERTLQAKADVQIAAFKGGASAEAAQATARKTDQENSLDRGNLDFCGGLGDPNAIDRAWIESLVDRPAIVKAKLERLSYLLTPRFFPDEEFIGELQKLLDIAIENWILTKGRPTGDTTPLHYGEAVVMIWPWPPGGKTELFGSFDCDPANPTPAMTFPDHNRDRRPFYGKNRKAALRILSGDGSNKNAVILAGDQVRIELIGVGFLDSNWLIGKAEPGRYTILHGDDNLRAPGRIGEYFQSSDQVCIIPAWDANRSLCVRSTEKANEAVIELIGEPENLSYYGNPSFLFRRCAEREED